MQRSLFQWCDNCQDRHENAPSIAEGPNSGCWEHRMRTGRVVQLVSPAPTLLSSSRDTPRVVGLRPTATRYDLTRTPTPVYLLPSTAPPPPQRRLLSPSSARTLSARPLLPLPTSTKVSEFPGVTACSQSSSHNPFLARRRHAAMRRMGT